MKVNTACFQIGDCSISLCVLKVDDPLCCYRLILSACCSGLWKQQRNAPLLHRCSWDLSRRKVFFGWWKWLLSLTEPVRFSWFGGKEVLFPSASGMLLRRGHFPWPKPLSRPKKSLLGSRRSCFWWRCWGRGRGKEVCVLLEIIDVFGGEGPGTVGVPPPGRCGWSWWVSGWEEVTVLSRFRWSPATESLWCRLSARGGREVRGRSPFFCWDDWGPIYIQWYFLSFLGIF